MREDERRKTREGEGAHYVSVISRIHECFQFTQRRRLYAPVRFRCVGASACQKRRCKRKGGRKKERKSREMEEAGKKKRRGKRRREERDSCEEEKLGASARAIYARIIRVNRVGLKTPREKKEREREREKDAHVSSSRVEAPGRFSAARVSQRELVRSLQNTEKCMSHLELPQATFFHRTNFPFLKSKHIYIFILFIIYLLFFYTDK